MRASSGNIHQYTGRIFGYSIPFFMKKRNSKIHSVIIKILTASPFLHIIKWRKQFEGDSMKKVCGFGLMCFSLGLFLSCFLSGFAIKFILLLSGAVIGYLLFHDHFCWKFTTHKTHMKWHEKRGNLFDSLIISHLYTCYMQYVKHSSYTVKEKLRAFYFAGS